MAVQTRSSALPNFLGRVLRSRQLTTHIGIVALCSGDADHRDWLGRYLRRQPDLRYLFKVWIGIRGIALATVVNYLLALTINAYVFRRLIGTRLGARRVAT